MRAISYGRVGRWPSNVLTRCRRGVYIIHCVTTRLQCDAPDGIRTSGDLQQISRDPIYQIENDGVLLRSDSHGHKQGRESREAAAAVGKNGVYFLS